MRCLRADRRALRPTRRRRQGFPATQGVSALASQRGCSQHPRNDQRTLCRCDAFGHAESRMFATVHDVVGHRMNMQSPGRPTAADRRVWRSPLVCCQAGRGAHERIPCVNAGDDFWAGSPAPLTMRYSFTAARSTDTTWATTRRGLMPSCSSCRVLPFQWQSGPTLELLGSSL